MPLPVQHSPLLRCAQFYYKPEKKTPFTLTLQLRIIINCTHAQSDNFSVQFIYELVLCHV